MAIQRAVLLIADIGGYTRFMSVHRINLAHAQDVVARLLEAVIDGAGKFRLAKLEGDAAFFYAPLAADANVAPLAAQVADIRRTFLAKQAEMELDRFCTCDGCVQAKQLTLKFVAHVGEVADQKVHGHRELAGVAVITVHRLLKNNVPVPEYVLMSDELHGLLDDQWKSQTQSQPETLEGLGEVTTHYVDLNDVNVVLPPLPTPSKWRTFRAWLGMTWRSLPYFVGAKTSCETFRNLGAIGEGAPVPPKLTS